MAAAKWTTRETLINSRAESILAYLSRCGSRSPPPLPSFLFFALVTVRQHRDEPKKEEGREEGKKRRR